MPNVNESPNEHKHDEKHSGSEALSAALYYHAHGCCVVPCCTMTPAGTCTFPHSHTSERSIGKVPILGAGWPQARLTHTEILDWWTKHPTANVGVLLEPSGLLAVDLDSREAEEEASTYGLPPGPQVRAGRGVHHYFRNQKKILGLTIKQGTSRAIDVLSKGIVVGFGSIHRSGKRYEQLVSWEECEIEEPPLWAEQLLLDSLKNHSAAADIADELPPVALEALDLPRWLSDLILRGPELHPGKYPSRSEAVWAVLTALIEAGHETDTIASILLDPRYKISAKPREQGARWLAAEIGRARAKTHSKSGNGKDPGHRHADTYENIQGEPAEETPQQKTRVTFNLTDTGNAERLAHQYGQVLRWCELWKKWLVYDTTHWHIDIKHRARQLAKATVRKMYADAEAANDDERRQKLAKYALQSESEKARRAMLELAKGEGKIPAIPEQFDADPWLLNVANGTLDLRTGVLHPHRQNDLLTKLIPIDYDPRAACPRWEAFLESIMAGNNDVIDFLWKAIGYSLTGDVREDCLFLLYGTGANGKSTFLTVLRAILADYGKQAAFSTFLHQERETVRNDLADLHGARLVVASETDEGKRFSLSVVKQLTGQDAIKARFLFAEYFEFAPQLKLWLAANHKPVIRGTDHAIWRRIRLIPFTQKYEGTSKDLTMRDKLLAELPGILAWAIRGCLAWQEEKLPLPETVKAATEGYRNEMDVVGAFIEECCEVEERANVLTASLFDAYVNWCKRSGEEASSKKTFGIRMEERGFTPGRGAGGIRIWKGLKLVITESS